MGTVNILSISRGHLELKFDKNDPIETDKARRAFKDLLSRGYVFFVKDETDQLRRVLDFDETRDEYIISDVPGLLAEHKPVSNQLPTVQESANVSSNDNRGTAATVGATGVGGDAGAVEQPKPTDAATKSGRGRGRGRKRVSAYGTDVHAVAPTGGG